MNSGDVYSLLHKSPVDHQCSRCASGIKNGQEIVVSYVESSTGYTSNRILCDDCQDTTSNVSLRSNERVLAQGIFFGRKLYDPGILSTDL